MSQHNKTTVRGIALAIFLSKVESEVITNKIT